MLRRNVEFTSEGLRCSAWFYPTDMPGSRPCVVLAHGLAGIKEMRLDAYAERFAKAGYHALVFDYRHFGESAGEPRQLLVIAKQHQDWRAAIAYARGRCDVDPSQIVLWGSSLSGGHVVAIAAEDKEVAAVVSQVPHMLGLASGLAGGLSAGTRLTFHAVIDQVGRLIGSKPHFVNAAAEPGRLGLMTAPGAARGYLKLVPHGKAFDQRVAARFVFDAMRYSPGKQLRNLTMPTLLHVAVNDLTTPAVAAFRSARGARKVVLKTHHADHFDPYVDPLFSAVVTEQLNFLEQALKPTPKRHANNGRPSVFITGAAKGIGKETALLFAKNGYVVGATDVNPRDLQALQETLGTGHFFRQLDVTISDEFARALGEFAEENGGVIDVLINNAGIAFIDDYEKVPLTQHLAVTEVNVKGVQIGAHHALRYLKKSERPVMLNMCSLSSEYGVPSEASYSASKFWVKGFTEALNIEWEQHGIHVCDVMPNFVATPMMEATHGKIVDSIGVHLRPRDVSEVIFKAVKARRKVHWEVDTWRPRLLRLVLKRVPNAVRRAAMRHVSGY